MRFLATGDWHLGAGADYGPRPGDRLRDQEAVVVAIAELAANEDVECVVHAGDVFEKRLPSPSELIVWRRFVERLGDYGIRLILASGNHDVAHQELPTGAEVLHTCSRTPEIIEIGSLSDPVFVATLPWVPPGRLIASRNGAGDRDELHAQVADLLIETARGLREQIPEGRTSILLAHWSVSGASTPTGMDVGLLREPVIPVHDLEEIGFDYVVLGHIHRRQLLGSENARGPMLYVGSPMCLNFGEAREEHGVWIIDTDYTPSAATPVGYRFVPIEDRPFVTVDADLTTDTWHYDRDEGEPTDETDAIAAAIAEHFPLTDAVVRLRYRATAEQARRVDHAALRGLLADAGVHKVFGIMPEIIRSERGRVADVDEQVEPLAAVDLWIAHQEVAQPDELRDLTAKYLEELAA